MQKANRTALVTGGSRGLGRSTVLAIARQGIQTIFTYHREHDRALEVAADAQAAGTTAIPLKLDTGEVGSFNAFAGQVRATLGELGTDRLDYLVNNAGISDHTPFGEVNEAVLDQLFAVNFKGVFFLTQKLLPLMADGGRIVNISTGLTRFWTPDTIPYASLKGAIEVFTHHLAKELGPRGITVNSVAPGAIATDFSGGTVRDNPEVNQRVAGMTALGRVGEPDDIGGMIASLLSEGNRWVTAQRIEASGGMQL